MIETPRVVIEWEYGRLAPARRATVSHGNWRLVHVYDMTAVRENVPPLPDKPVHPKTPWLMVPAETNDEYLKRCDEWIRAEAIREFEYHYDKMMESRTP